MRQSGRNMTWASKKNYRLWLSFLLGLVDPVHIKGDLAGQGCVYYPLVLFLSKLFFPRLQGRSQGQALSRLCRNASLMLRKEVSQSKTRSQVSRRTENRYNVRVALL